MKLILADMDGTLIDPKLGFVRCIYLCISKELNQEIVRCKI
ncbi:hypothetical protein MNBD_GAMMA22-1071 [hydrothermal vent metagenome]|uniref:Uncharacterized protein n=1 Tax=hydrothermal vent metagenome TaxID=652676 RepID=A0A3B1AIY8_9ZZZZ